MSAFRESSRTSLPVTTFAPCPEMGWSGIKNGPLLRRAAQQFDVFLTVDHGIRHQQSLVGIDLAIVLLVATSNDINDLRPLMSRVRETLGNVSPGSIVRIQI